MNITKFSFIIMVNVILILQLKSDVITHYGLKYEIVTSPITGEKWLDRNLGAKQACTSSNDTLCYGDYYQWGRLSDGHEKSNSTITSIQVSTILDVGEQFISGYTDWTTTDVNGTQRAIQWNKVDGTGICPVGFRVPTQTELANETTEYEGNENISIGAVKVTNNITAFQNFLKFPSFGMRDRFDGSNSRKERSGGVWTNSIIRKNSLCIIFTNDYATWYNYVRASGFSVRCIDN